MQKLVAYDRARDLPGRDAPLIFRRDSIDSSSPVSVPYAVIVATGGDLRDRFVKIRDKATQERADIVVLDELEPQYAGTVGMYWGFGVSSAEPVYRGVTRGICCRFAGARLGFSIGEDNMITAVSADARDSGMQEGDKLLSINGDPWGNWDTPSYSRLYLGLKPGDSVKLVWLRPGVGRMEGVAIALENSRVDVTDLD
jgi:hypothetical protein